MIAVVVKKLQPWELGESVGISFEGFCESIEWQGSTTQLLLVELRV